MIQLVWFEPLQARVSANPAAQVRFVNFLGSVTAPRVFLPEFALLEMIAELSNSHRAGVRCSAIGVDFRNQHHYGATRGILIRVSLDCADNLFVVTRLPSGPVTDHRNCQTSGPRLRLSLSMQPCCIHLLLYRSCGAERIFRHGDEDEVSQVNCFAGATLFPLRAGQDNFLFCPAFHPQR